MSEGKLTPEELETINKFKTLYNVERKNILNRDYFIPNGRGYWIFERPHESNRFLNKLGLLIPRSAKTVLSEVERVDKELKTLHGQVRNLISKNKSVYYSVSREFQNIFQSGTGFDTLLYDLGDRLNPDPADIPERDPVDILKSIKGIMKGLNKWKPKRTVKTKGKNVLPSNEGLSGRQEGFERPRNAEKMIEKRKIKKIEGNKSSERELNRQSSKPKSIWG
ncbi:hypothetical protein V1387_18190 [Allomuricauda taeanensis]|uniref:hypothetical protein n=1 Tax=Flagellimonas taeanensis TaxID=1005926 RepID=UPI002E7B38BC|nr:hypothetical protein [Allomuricauda taeanensis]MEE1964622.1 hypothetical protein [Allomuricauda taeanensis]